MSTVTEGEASWKNAYQGTEEEEPWKAGAGIWVAGGGRETPVTSLSLGSGI